ncbi:unnamed protein product [Ambrosiozyma monospora]|uniref:Unnamed protein product n=1 Tax=Ambrosiozyma monospora TaxID=43982 RepID=A0A9W7DG18_AMBMO|nr:unnamed protein product [Ambrosiozyma monospora]
MSSSSKRTDKPHNSKSRHGCITCKKHKIKCDETKPQCKNCVNRGLLCGGYVQTFKFKGMTFDNDGVPSSTSSKKKSKSSKAKVLRLDELESQEADDSKMSELFKSATLSITGKSYQEILIENHLKGVGKNPNLATELNQVINNFKQDGASSTSSTPHMTQSASPVSYQPNYGQQPVPCPTTVQSYGNYSYPQYNHSVPHQPEYQQQQQVHQPPHLGYPVADPVYYQQQQQQQPQYYNQPSQYQQQKHQTPYQYPTYYPSSYQSQWGPQQSPVQQGSSSQQVNAPPISSVGAPTSVPTSSIPAPTQGYYPSNRGVQIGPQLPLPQQQQQQRQLPFHLPAPPPLQKKISQQLVSFQQPSYPSVPILTSGGTGTGSGINNSALQPIQDGRQQQQQPPQQLSYYSNSYQNYDDWYLRQQKRQEQNQANQNSSRKQSGKGNPSQKSPSNSSITKEGVGPGRPPPLLSDQTSQRTKEELNNPGLLLDTSDHSISSSLKTTVPTSLPIISKQAQYSSLLGGGHGGDSGDTPKRQQNLQQKPTTVSKTFISDSIDGSNIMMTERIFSTQLSSRFDESGCLSCNEGDIMTSRTISGNSSSGKQNINGSIADVRDSIDVIDENGWNRGQANIVSEGFVDDDKSGSGGSGATAPEGKEETGRIRLPPQEFGLNDEESAGLGSSRGGKRSIVSVDEVGGYGITKAQSRDNEDKDDEIHEVCEDGSILHLVLPAPKFSKYNKHQFFLNSFDNYTSKVMCIYQEKDLNPWMSKFVPIIDNYPILSDLVAMLTCFHISKGDPELKCMGVEFMLNSFRKLALGLKNDSLPLDVSLASCFLLSLGEIWDKGVQQQLSHLKSACYFIKKKIEEKSEKEKMEHAAVQCSEMLNSTQKNSYCESMVVNASDEMLELTGNNSIVVATPSPSNRSSSRSAFDKSYFNFLFSAWQYMKVLSKASLQDSREDIVKADVESINFGEQFKIKRIVISDGEPIDHILGVGQVLFTIMDTAIDLINYAKDLPDDNYPSNLSDEACDVYDELISWKPDLQRIKNQIGVNAGGNKRYDRYRYHSPNQFNL